MRVAKAGHYLAGASFVALGLLATPAIARNATEQEAVDEEVRPILPNAGTIRSFYGPATGSAGTIRSFEGDAESNAGTIRSFAGTIRSFAGTIRSFEKSLDESEQTSSTFWGTLAPNAGTIRSFDGTLEAQAGTIRSFAGTIRSFAGTIRSFEETSADYAQLMGHLNDLIATSEGQYAAAVQQRTAMSFDQAITTKLLDKYGIDRNDPATLDLNELGIELFLLDWYDNLQAYSGRDSVDLWMKQINWSPSLTQSSGSGFDSRIGLLDFTVTGEGTGNIVKAGGISEVSGGHGSAVLSLIAGAHDGFGVMGIAPRASVVSYNPFDETLTAGWHDIREGVKYLTKNDASVINMSLGVPGYTLASGWNEVFSSGSVSKEAKTRVFVLSAGNDGIVQTQDVDWDFKKNPEFIVVGSVDHNDVISSFSNQPGTACLLGKKGCGGSADLLMNRFIVAPGELILVSDGQGGVTRMSGTSFAAPLVSGTIALLHDRWPWLVKKPEATVNIILSTARDLGAPGTDPVYGRGLLDVQSALSPLAWDKLDWKVHSGGKEHFDKKAGFIGQDVEQLRKTWEASGAYIVLFDEIDDTFRDFTVPLSSKLVGQTVGKAEDLFLAYLQSRFWDWAAVQATAVDGGKNKNKLSFASNVDAPLSVSGGWTATLSVSRDADVNATGRYRNSVGTIIALASPESRFGFALGQGEGAQALAGQAGFALTSDSALATGGVNPLLSFASGGAFGQLSYALTDRLGVRVAVTGKDQQRNLDVLGPRDRMSLAGLEPSHAQAGLVTLDYQVDPRLSANVSYTLLDEGNGLLGMQSLDETDFRSGTRTDALTLGSQFAMTPTLTLAASATVGRTRQGDLSRQNIAVSSGGLVNSAFQVGLTKTELFGASNIARLTIAQPLHVETGNIDINAVEVVDRLTGELGTVVQTVGLDTGPRNFVAEGLYGHAVLNGAGSLNLFGRAMLRGETPARNEPGFTAGANVKVRF